MAPDILLRHLMAGLFMVRVFKIYGNSINAYKLLKDTPNEDLNKTNVIDTKELVFSDVYIKNNLELVSSFLNVIIIKRKINNRI